MNFENLKKLDREQLLELAGKTGVQIHPRSKDDTIRKKIVENALTPHKPEVHDQRLAPTREAVFNTPEDVEKALTQVKTRQPKFQTIYNEEERTVKFSCLGAEETHNLSVPLHWLVKRAQLIMRGRLAPRGLNEHFDSLASSTGKNAYTNTVLA